jgi:uncharacterized protein (DUF1501 family)
MTPVSRRYFLQDCGIGLGKIAAAGIMTNAWRDSQAAGNSIPKTTLAPQPAHFRGQAKSVIHLFMAGAPSQLDLYDPKPMLSQLEGQPLPKSIIGDQRYAFIQPDAGVMGPQFSFSQHGDCGATLAAPLKHLSQVVDDLCILRSVHTDQFNHAPAQLLFNSGFSQPGRPSLGSWVTYGLGTESDNLPAFVVMSTGSGLSAGSALWSSGFLPTVYTGVRLRSGRDPILNVSTPQAYSAKLQQETYRLVNELNRSHQQVIGDPEISTRIAAFEMASRLQVSAPELMDLTSESAATLDRYGCDPQQDSFARACLLARRMVERGVRFVNIYHEGWDAHSNVKGNCEKNCRITDQASAALITDLKARGMLDETLVIWGGEFGRTPMVETNPALGRKAGRDHHPQAFTMWLAGGGIQGGITYGATDDFGFHIVENPIHVHDIQATILHALGLNHEQLTYQHAGRDFRLTDVHGKVIHDILKTTPNIVVR